MYLIRFQAILDYLFCRHRKRALCYIPTSALLRCLLVVAAILSSRAAEASVLVSGDVTPSDNPFTLNINEGLPKDGNKTDPFATPSPPEQNQTFWEGINDAVNNTNINVNVFVGSTASGILQISQVELRDMNLVIGDSGTVNGNTRLGDGVVYVTGMGSLFNNDPYLIPPSLQPPNVINFKSKNPRLMASAQNGLDGPADGFDLYVGKSGNGTFRVDAFGRAEIEDAVLVGDAAGAVGNLIVDGFNSYLGNGGSNDFGATSETKLHLTIVGRQGTGNVTVSNGATFATQVFGTSGGNTVGAVGAVLGSTPYSVTIGQTPDAGGSGTATITGSGSKWTIGGSLQVGGFDIGLTGGTTIGDLEGDNTQYGSQAGRGTLYVNDGGIVTVHNAIGIAPGDITTPLVLAIGRFGTVNLNGGTIEVGTAQGGQQNQATPDSVQVVNDGLITGTGRIDTGVFRNRYFGIVQVNAGQSLVIDSTSQFATGANQTPAEPLTNYGKIQVFGNANAQAELEFVRAPTVTTISNVVRPFINLPLAAPPVGGFAGGQISAQYANLRFDSGLENHSVVAFTAGTNNITGKVVNLFSGDIDEPDGDADDFTTQILVSGPGTKAVFHDDLAIGATTSLNLVNGANVDVLNANSFTLAGFLGINLSYTHPSLIDVVGNVGIGGAGSWLNVNLDADALHSLKHGDAFKIVSYGGIIGNVDNTNPNDPVPDLTKAPIFTTIKTSPNVKALYGLDTVVEFANSGVYVEFLNPAMVGSGAVAPDFNGDGVVDLADFAIWQAHAGIMSGASVLDGDADGDGDVDGADFLKWQRNVGKPMPWVGAGSQVSTVPEPASLAMLICGGSLALAFGRRRVKR